jgi:hypothetical protein
MLKAMGCCMDKSCTPDTCMVLPGRMVCGDCEHLSRCHGLFQCKPERTSCDFFPRRFVKRTRLDARDLAANAALQVALNLVSGALCDASTVPVPSDPAQYGDAVRELVAERDALKEDSQSLASERATMFEKLQKAEATIAEIEAVLYNENNDFIRMAKAMSAMRAIIEKGRGA